MTYAPGVRALPQAFVLRKRKPRTITVLGPDGHPLAGALISPRVMSIGAEGLAADMPESLAGAAGGHDRARRHGDP